MAPEGLSPSTLLRPCPGCGTPCPHDVLECGACGSLLIDPFGAMDAGSTNPSRAVPNPASGDVGAGWSEPFPDVMRTGVIPSLTPLGDRYEILELLGEGGMGRVYKARDLELDRIVALKTIRGDRARDPEALQRFKQELLLASTRTSSGSTTSARVAASSSSRWRWSRAEA